MSNQKMPAAKGKSRGGGGISAAAVIGQFGPAPTTNVGSGLRTDDSSYDVHKFLDQFWPYQVEKIAKMSPTEFRETKISQELPLARIKKIMKLDEDVKTQMVSAEAPVLFAKACEMFIEELTTRAWVHTEDNKRKTLQKNDIAMAISKHDQFDFLIDIVPREEIVKSSGGGGMSNSPTHHKRAAASPIGHHSAESHLPMFVQVAGPGTPGVVAQPAMQTIQLQNGQLVQAQSMAAMNQPLQLIQGANGELQLVSIGQTAQATAQVLQTAPLSQHQTQPHHPESNGGGQGSSASFAQAFQQIVAPDGTVHHLPIQLSPAQMNYLKQHLTSGGGGQLSAMTRQQSSGNGGDGSSGQQSMNT